MSDEIRNIAGELEAAARLEDSELGEWWLALVGLIPRVFDSASPEFLAAFEAELQAEYSSFKSEYCIVEVTEQKIIRYKELRLLSELSDERS